jgi:hypothetical protein
VTRAALAYLVDGRDLAVGFLDLANRMGVTVAVEARGLPRVDTTADRTQLATVTVAATVFVGQRLHTTLVALVHDVRMTLTALDVRMRCGRILDVFMTREAILQCLSTGERCDKQKPETENRFRARDPGRDRIHCPESLCEWL